MDPGIEKVVIVSHSQGSLITSIVIDWVLQELPRDLVKKMEIYTFGNAANHFNSPSRSISNSQVPSYAGPVTGSSHGLDSESLPSTETTNLLLPNRTTLHEGPIKAAGDRAIYHIEHYAHTTDFVSQISVLYFTHMKQPHDHIPNYTGRIFARTSVSTGGHQFVQHYLDGMFPVEKNESGEYTAVEDSEFMNSILTTVDRRHVDQSITNSMHDVDISSECPHGSLGDDTAISPPSIIFASSNEGKVIRVKDLSRLGRYLNGGDPDA
ncbi:hypothetical protein BROUX41_005051 [Berkeleyomyces rouxiae]|uniref:uncharacterized protein n=1 Tax=Berkeleyomyces rouxiae TaxID=2035830 RepID=UPI003B7A989F